MRTTTILTLRPCAVVLILTVGLATLHAGVAYGQSRSPVPLLEVNVIPDTIYVEQPCPTTNTVMLQFRNNSLSDPIDIDWSSVYILHTPECVADYAPKSGSVTSIPPQSVDFRIITLSFVEACNGDTTIEFTGAIQGTPGDNDTALLTVECNERPPQRPAEWSFHFRHSDCPGGWLQVWGTRDCVRVHRIFDGPIEECRIYKGPVPPWCNDYETEFVWDYWCGNVDTHKTAVARYDTEDERWVLEPLEQWTVDHLEEPLTMPMLGDDTGDIQNVYLVADVDTWRLDPKELLPSYDIVDGRCDDLPGYLIGTTPITFNPDAASDEDPFGTTPLTGTLVRDGERTVGPTWPIPAVSEWGLVVMTLLVLAAGTIWLC